MSSDCVRCCGGGEIRTPGTFQYDGFQDRSIKPLWHSSGDNFLAGAKVEFSGEFLNAMANHFFLF